jgi:hypothetical protein
VGASKTPATWRCWLQYVALVLREEIGRGTPSLFDFVVDERYRKTVRVFNDEAGVAYPPHMVGK